MQRTKLTSSRNDDRKMLKKREKIQQVHLAPEFVGTLDNQSSEEGSARYRTWKQFRSNKIMPQTDVEYDHRKRLSADMRSAHATDDELNKSRARQRDF